MVSLIIIAAKQSREEEGKEGMTGQYVRVFASG